MIENYFESIDSEAKAYWLGFLFADGNVSARVDGRKAINLSQKEADIPASFLAHIDSSYRVGQQTGRKGNITHRAQIYSQKMFDDLVSLGCVPAKCHILEPPTIDLGEFTRDFIRGYNDGDGGIYIYGRRNCVRMRGTLKLLSWIKEELPKGSLLYDYQPTAQLFVTKKSALAATLHYLYDGATLFHHRKHDVAQRIMLL